MINKTVSVIGGDSRQIYAAEHLSFLGYKVGIYACEHGKIGGQIYISENLKNAFESDFIILPLPVSKNSKTLNSPLSSLNIEIKDIAELTTEKNTVFLGMGNKSLVKLLEARAKLVCDYYLIEKPTVYGSYSNFDTDFLYSKRRKGLGSHIVFVMSL